MNTEQARREGMAYALRVAKQKGIKGLEEDLAFRSITDAPIAISKYKVDNFCNNVKMNTIDTMRILTCVTLLDEFDFTEEQLVSFIKRFDKKAECIMKENADWNDMIDILRDERGILATIRKNERNV